MVFGNGVKRIQAANQIKSTVKILQCFVAFLETINFKINHLSIWPFLCHSCFPTGKVSKVAFFPIQSQLFSPCIVLNNWVWKRETATLETVSYLGEQEACTILIHSIFLIFSNNFKVDSKVWTFLVLVYSINSCILSRPTNRFVGEG